jgi:hypothetical protein
MNLSRFWLANLILILCPVGTYAQCVDSTTLVCVTGTCTQSVPANYVSNHGIYGAGGNISCCGQTYYNYFQAAFTGCEIAKNLNTPAATKALVRLISHGPVFLVACSGDFNPFSSRTTQDRSWSADRALDPVK